MRIAYFTEVFLPKLDGIVTTLTHLLRYLDEQGHEALIFTPEGGPERFGRFDVIGLPGHPFPLYPELKLVSPTIDVQPELMAFQPDLIHTVGPISLGLAGNRAAQKLNIPLVSSYHTDVPGFAEQWGLGMLNEAIWGYLRWVHNQADLNLCPSYATLDTLANRNFTNLDVWTRGVDVVQFHPKHRTVAWRERLTNGQPERPLLVYVGRVSYEKRINWLLPLMEALPDVHLAIVGDGPARHELEALFAHTNTVFTGFLRGHDLASAYAAGDVFVFPSAHETFGNVLLEAMASGVPVIAAQSGGPLDFIQHGENGLFFAPHNPDDLVEVTAALLNNPEQRAAMGRSARRYAEGRDWHTVFDRLLEQYWVTIATRAAVFAV